MSSELPVETPSVPRPRWRRLSLIGSAVLAIGGVVFVGGRRSVAAATPEHQPLTADATGVTLSSDAPQWAYLQLATAAAEPALAPLPAPARVDLDESRTASIGTPLAGRIEQVLVRLGDSVHKGDRLFSVRSGSFADLEKDVASAQASVAVKQRLHDRAKELAALQAIPGKEEEELAAELKDAQLTLKAAQARRQSLAVAPGADNLFWVLAPRDGVVVTLEVFASQTVTPDRDRPLLSLSSLDQVLVVADLQEAEAADARPGLKVQILLPNGQAPVTGTVEHVSQVVDPQRRTVALRVRAPNAHGVLRPNGFVQVVLPPATAATHVRVPSDAVVSEGSESVVFVDSGNGRLKRVSVVLGRQRDGEVEIASGLDAGQRYVSRGALLLLNQIDLVD